MYSRSTEKNRFGEISRLMAGYKPNLAILVDEMADLREAAKAEDIHFPVRLAINALERLKETEKIDTGDSRYESVFCQILDQLLLDYPRT